MKKSNGFGLIEVMIAMGVLSILAVGMMTFFQNMGKSTNNVEFQGKRSQVRLAILNQFLANPMNCACLFSGADNFPVDGITALTGTTPTSIGLYKFITPGDCTGATQISPFISTTAPIDGMLAQSISLKNIVNASGAYTGNLSVVVKSTKTVAGQNTLTIDIPVGINVANVSPGVVKLTGCATVSPAATPDPIEVIKNKQNLQDYDFSPTYGGSGGVGPSTSECGNDTFMTGIRAQVTATVQRITALCNNHASTEFNRGSEIGGGHGGGAAFPPTCPAGMWINGLTGKGAAGIDLLSFSCMDPITHATAPGPSVGGGGGSFQGAYTCPLDHYVFRIVGFGGDVFDRIGFVCAKGPMAP